MRRIGLVLVALMVSMSFYGQVWDSSKPDKRFTFGVRAGINFSSAAVDKKAPNPWFVSGVKSKMGFHVGGIVDYNVIKSFAIESGLFFSSKVFEFDYGVDGLNSIDEYTEKSKRNYLQIPLLGKCMFPVAENLQLQVNVGGYFGYNIGGGHWPIDGKVDTGIIFGAGVIYRSFNIGAQYELGLNDLSKKHYGVRNRNLMISLGYNL